MNISIIGTGYVGLVSGVCFAELGHNVICVDVDKEKIEKINNGISPIYEEKLDDLLKKNKENISATTDYEFAITNSEITFICVGTPSLSDGDIDLSYIKEATVNIARELYEKNDFHIVVVKSTVVPGTTENVVLPLLEDKTKKKAGIDFGVGMNPEFLREGVAVNDFLHPDRIVIGSYDHETKRVLSELYQDFDCPIIRTSLSAAEMIKYASNSFLATKISFINEIGNMCKELNIDTYDVADGMGFDKRIERSFLNAGIGWGGSCFPKDVKALSSWAKKHDVPSQILESVVRVNNEQPLRLINLLKEKIPNLDKKTVGILGLSFKPETDDIRETRSAPLIQALLDEGAKVKVFDPKAMTEFKKLFPQVTYCSTGEEVLDSDIVIIATAWDEFRRFDYSKNIVIDGRRLLETKKTAQKYEGICW